MRKFIIDTDTASDDAAAIIIAAMQNDVELLGVTTVAGNVEKRQSADNALATLEVCGSDVPVFMGATKPLMRKRQPTISVHGKDGMGDCDLIHPTRKPEDMSSYLFIIEQVKKYPDEVEIVALGPVTNIAIAILAEPEIMSHVKRIWSMGTPGLGMGNATPVSEFNVYIDAEAYKVMLDSGIPVTIAGFDLCVGEIEFDKGELEMIASGNRVGRFLERATNKLLQYNIDCRGEYLVDLPDAVSLATALWPEYVEESIECACKVCIGAPETYGQVLFYPKGRTFESMPEIENYNVTLVTKVNQHVFTIKLLTLLTKQL